MRAPGRRLTCELAVIGGSLGGVAAALAAAEAGARVVLTEATDWLGGQITSQGVAALDEHAHIERFGGTRLYHALRARVRAHYTRRYGAPARSSSGAPLNPGNGWVSRLCFEPRVGLAVLEAMLAPHVASGRVTVLLAHRPVAARVQGNRVQDVALEAPQGRLLLAAEVFLDATDTGELLPLTMTPFVTGAEAQDDTGETHAAQGAARPDEVQSFTVAFAVAHRPGEDHTIARPPGYARWRDSQPYTFQPGGSGRPRFRMFAPGDGGELPFWSYRRLFDGALLTGDPGDDVALINWAGNDYYATNLLGAAGRDRQRILHEAKALSLGLLYWLQTEAPRDQGGFGYPGLRLLPELLGTRDGLAKAPYIRESRRLLARTRVGEMAIAASSNPGARARAFADSVGVGFYPMDLHASVGNPGASLYEATKPFQVPLGALLSVATTNLLAACKNIGTTHVTSGAYRLHPCEWAIGEAAGRLAAYAVRKGVSLARVHDERRLLVGLQLELLAAGAPLAWTVDVPPAHPLFSASQMLVLAGALNPAGARARALELRLHHPLGADEGTTREAFRRLAGSALMGAGLTWAEACRQLAPWLERTLAETRR